MAKQSASGPFGKLIDRELEEVKAECNRKLSAAGRKLSRHVQEKKFLEEQVKELRKEVAKVKRENAQAEGIQLLEKITVDRLPTIRFKTPTIRVKGL